MKRAGPSLAALSIAWFEVICTSCGGGAGLGESLLDASVGETAPAVESGEGDSARRSFDAPAGEAAFPVESDGGSYAACDGSCGPDALCAYLVDAGCSAAGVCVPLNGFGPGCGRAPSYCGCDGTGFVGRCDLPTGYVPAPVERGPYPACRVTCPGRGDAGLCPTLGLQNGQPVNVLVQQALSGSWVGCSGYGWTCVSTDDGGAQWASDDAGAIPDAMSEGGAD
jgi:hypothetical protein